MGHDLILCFTVLLPIRLNMWVCESPSRAHFYRDVQEATKRKAMPNIQYEAWRTAKYKETEVTQLLWCPRGIQLLALWGEIRGFCQVEMLPNAIVFLWAHKRAKQLFTHLFFFCSAVKVDIISKHNVEKITMCSIHGGSLLFDFSLPYRKQLE